MICPAPFTGFSGEMGRTIPYDTSEYVMDFCIAKAKELRASGEYAGVRIRKTVFEDGRQYARIYVIEKD